MKCAELERLDRDGFVVLEHFLEPDYLNALRKRTDELLAQEGDAAGSEFKKEPYAHRLANLVDKGEVFERAVMMPRILELSAHVLGPNFKLGSVNFRSADPHSPLRPAASCGCRIAPGRERLYRLQYGLDAGRFYA
jgi:Phytanoyl-CoA dioxygenase (PhyH)